MKILLNYQIKEWDQYTIQNLPISSIDLMERASIKCVKWIQNNLANKKQAILFVGIGNNGGDGLAIARFLKKNGVEVEVYILGDKEKGSPDFKEQLNRAAHEGVHYYPFKDHSEFIDSDSDTIVLDALFGTGLNRPLEGDLADGLERINKLLGIKIAVDIPSGLSADFSFQGGVIFRADFTLSFQVPKMAFLLPENEAVVGDWHILDIGLMPEYLTEIPLNTELLDPEDIRDVLKERPKYAHKGTFGHTLLIGGNYGMTGAIMLASKAAMRMGTGLLSVTMLPDLYGALLSNLPEAMAVLSEDKNELHYKALDFDKYKSIGIGPGLGQTTHSLDLLKQSLEQSDKSLVIDADAINLLGRDKRLLSILPPKSILTPHVKEFDRITHAHNNHHERIASARAFAVKYQCILILKGAYTAVISSEGKCFFNATGNPGMATGGSGDVLLGIISALLAQGIEPLSAAKLGVYLHGMAGDFAAEDIGEHSLIASDIIDNLPRALLAYARNESRTNLKKLNII
jgi:NAD(P)H-hydrate epimerase